MNGVGEAVHPISKLLVANRAEIATRVFRTASRMGISTVAVFSDADSHLPYVSEADEAVRLPGTAPRDTYLSIEHILEAASLSGADAIHPGYGFLSENPAFVEACVDNDLVFIGP
ncbi:MAG TPA: biotin carboxylase N-terminal domain-containing protein, partial [Acidimicrobiales bacterium]|nr:biotin carboxylase N-terminal domain-containing protein [Acidimicrobiales bacterium]